MAHAGALVRSRGEVRGRHGGASQSGERNGEVVDGITVQRRTEDPKWRDTRPPKMCRECECCDEDGIGLVNGIVRRSAVAVSSVLWMWSVFTAVRDLGEQ